MEKDSDAVRVPLFDGTNYPSWKFRMLVVLEEHEMTECIEEEVAEVETLRVSATDNESVKAAKLVALEARKKKDRKCKSILISRISDSQLEYVQDQPTPRSIWLALQRVFERKSIASRLHLKKKLLTLRHEGGDLQEHFLRFDRLVREYKSTGAVIEDIDVVCHLLITLGSEYATVVTAIETMPEEHLTLEFVKCRLLDEEIKCRGKDFDSISVKREPSAFAGKPTGAVKKWKCFACSKVGHKAADCPERQKVKKGENKKSSANVSEEKAGGICFAAESCVRGEKVQWIADSGASEHMSNNKNLFEELVPLKDPVEIAVALNDKSAIAKCSGSIRMIAVSGSKKRECTLENVLYAPDLRCNLFSIRKVEMAGMEVVFKDGGVRVLKDSEVVACGRRRGLQYEMDFYVDNTSASSSYSCGKLQKCNELWHRRYGHLSEKNLELIAKKNMVTGFDKCAVKDSREMFCEPCIEAKQTRKPFVSCSEKRATRVLELIHTDVCGPVTPVGHDGSRYYVSFIDDWSRFIIVYTIRSKDQVYECFKLYEAMVTAKFGRKIARVRSDNGGEYRNEQFEKFCEQKGIQMECTVPYSPEQNGVSERMNRTLVEKARAMLIGSGVAKTFWCEAVETAAYLVNRSPASALKEGKTPFELWEGRKPNISGMRVWGSPAYCHVPKETRKKLDSKAWKGIFLGYHSNGYRIWDPKRKKVVVQRDVIIDESRDTSKEVPIPEKIPADSEIIRITREDEVDDADTAQEVGDSHDTTFEDCDEGTGSESEDEDSAGAVGGSSDETRTSSRRREPPVWHRDYDMNCAYAMSATNFVEGFPDTLEEMRKRDDWPLWDAAVKEEMSSHRKNNTWKICKLPEGRKPVSCKWVFKLKRGENGAADRYKARLVARGFSQRFGYDYSETYAPVARMDTVRTVLAVANQERLKVHQMDVKTAFLNGNLEEEIYMTLPEGLEGEPNDVCRLNRSLYGLKQASRAWNERFHQFVTKLGFRQSENDRCLYVRGEGDQRIILLLYVDDILIVCRNLKDIEKVKKRLAQEFEMSDLGPVGNFLGMCIERDEEKRILRISQRAYLESLLCRFGMESCKPAATPMENRLQLKKGEEANRTSKPYRELVGCLAYVAQCSRPDLCASVNFFSQYQSCPTEEHWNFLKRILRYVQGTLDIVLEFHGSDKAEPFTVYSDSDWGNDVNDRRSITGCVFRVFGGTTAWLTRKQQTVALSSTEAEFVALCTAACEGIWIRRLLEDLGVVIEGPVKYFEDNQSCIKVTEEPRDSRRLKHVDVKFNFVRELVKKKCIDIRYIPSEKQLADIMTKGLASTAFNRLRGGIGLQKLSRGVE